MVVKNEETGEKFLEEHYSPDVDCHFLHIEGKTVAALSHCTEDDIVRLTIKWKLRFKLKVTIL